MKSKVDQSFRLLAARYLRKQVKQLGSQIEGIRKAEDIEFVHRARVASRRLRAALRVFAECFPAERADAWRKEIRRLARSLGEARDGDVQIAFLSDALCRFQDRTGGPGFARVLARWERGREKLQPSVTRAIERLVASRVLREMLAATRKWLRRGGKEKDLRPSRRVFDHTERHVLTGLDDLRTFEPCLANPEDHEQHHAMRIAAKRLRYTIEICKSIYGGRLDGVLEAVKQVQSLLGDIHDCDVWVEQLGTFQARESRRFVRLYGHAGPLARLKPGIEHLQQDRRKRREELFATLVQYWSELTRAGLWKELTRVVRSRGKPAARKALRLPERPAAARARGEVPAAVVLSPSASIAGPVPQSSASAAQSSAPVPQTSRAEQEPRVVVRWDVGESSGSGKGCAGAVAPHAKGSGEPPQAADRSAWAGGDREAAL